MRHGDPPAPASGWPHGEWSEIDITFHQPYRNPGGTFHISGPKVEIDGRDIAVTWQHGRIRVPAGSRHVRVWLPYPKFGAFGPATYVCYAPPRDCVRLEYRPPLFPGMNGALGPPRQSSPGCLFVVIVMLVAIACLCGGALLAGFEALSA